MLNTGQQQYVVVVQLVVLTADVSRTSRNRTNNQAIKRTAHLELCRSAKLVSRCKLYGIYLTGHGMSTTIPILHTIPARYVKLSGRELVRGGVPAPYDYWFVGAREMLWVNPRTSRRE